MTKQTDMRTAMHCKERSNQETDTKTCVQCLTATKTNPLKLHADYYWVLLLKDKLVREEKGLITTIYYTSIH